MFGCFSSVSQFLCKLALKKKSVKDKQSAMEKAKTLAARSCMHICTLCKYRAVYVHLLLSKEGCGWHTWDIVVQGCKKIFLVENKLFLFSIYKSTSPLMEILIYIPVLSFPFPVLQNSVVVISNTGSNCM